MHEALVSRADFHASDPSRSFDDPIPHCRGIPWYWDEPSLASATATNADLSYFLTHPAPLLPIAKSPASLYRNILYLLSFRKPPPSLPALIDYHDLHPMQRSTRSYNLLISHALRHASFGMVQWLLTSMTFHGIPPNHETSKLRVRWLVQRDWWEYAWRHVQKPSERPSGSGTPQSVVSGASGALKDPIPLPVWLEFFRTSKSRALRGSPQRRKPSWDVVPGGEHGYDAAETAPAPDDALSEDSTSSASLLTQRYLTLLRDRPVFRDGDIPPQAVYFIVLGFLRLKEQDSALKLTMSYLSTLPPVVSAKRTRACLDVIHLHIIYGSDAIGLRRLHQSRRTLMSLLALHPSLRPTSTTLFLLLGHLRKATRSGSHAWDVLQAFKRRWGRQVEDDRVRRRVASLAIKEGRMDIVDEVFRVHKLSKRKLPRKVAEESVHVPKKLSRMPHSMTYESLGKERRLWLVLRQRRWKRLTRTS